MNDSMRLSKLGKPERVPESSERCGIRRERQENTGHMLVGSQNKRAERTGAQ